MSKEIEQSINEIMDGMEDNPREWAETFLEMRMTLENLVNTVDAYKMMLSDMMHLEEEESNSNIH